MSADNDAGQVDMSTLTPEEQAVLAEGEFSPEEVAAMKAVADEAGDGQGDGAGNGGQVDDDDDDDPDTGADDAAARQAAEPAAAPAADAAPAAGQDATPAANKPPTEPVAAEPFVPRYEAKLPEDFQQRQDALNTRRNELVEQFRSGDIDFDEYQTRERALSEERDALLATRIKAEISTDMTQQTAEQRWLSTLSRFKGQIRESAGIDYDNDPVRGPELDTVVRTLANNPVNADKPMEWFLREGHRIVNALHAGDPRPTPTDPQQGKPNAQGKPPERATNVRQPATLAHVPGGGGSDDIGSAFANLDGLDGQALEDAIARMSPQQYENYLAGQ